jgi:hypothetical protein
MRRVDGMRGNPSALTGEACILCHLADDPRISPIDDRAALAVSRMHAIPAFFEQARQCIDEARASDRGCKRLCAIVRSRLPPQPWRRFGLNPSR